MYKLTFDGVSEPIEAVYMHLFLFNWGDFIGRCTVNTFNFNVLFIVLTFAAKSPTL